jgi:beta-N-acetylhexosaminidase
VPTPAPGTPSTVPSTSSASSSSTAAAPSGTASCVTSIVDHLSASERAGQLLMVGLDVNAARTSLDRLVTDRHLGSVILLGGWHSGVASVRSTTSHLAGLASDEATGGLGLFIAADQEGGAVQQLRGAGFSRMPSALSQGNLSDGELTREATTWAGQIKAAGINVNLAPVADTVPDSVGTANQPIGRWDREYSHDPAKVADKSVAFLAGMHAGGVATTIKHFPGLGRITGNTDLTATGITDSQTTMTDPYLEPFRSGIRAGADFVMVGSAIYSRIDPGVNAVFSTRIITDLLRDRLGHRGVVITDDVGAAKSVAAVPAGDRATRFIAAGGDIVLTAVPSTVPTMHRAITARMTSDPAFAAQVQAAVTRVVQLKLDRGLARCR